MHSIEIRTAFPKEGFWHSLYLTFNTFRLRATVKKLAQKILKAQCLHDNLSCKLELSVLITNSTYMQELNYKYRNKNISTDVLSFPLINIPSAFRKGIPSAKDTVAIQKKIHNPLPISHNSTSSIPSLIPPTISSGIPLGDVVISYSDCLLQMKAVTLDMYVVTPKNLKQLFSLLLIHGILHLFGYDHEVNNTEKRYMEDREYKLFTELCR